MWYLNIKLEQPLKHLRLTFFSKEVLILKASGLLFAAYRVGGVGEGMVDGEVESDIKDSR